MSSTWTADGIRQLLDRSDRAVERAVVAIYERQTTDEQDVGETRHRNGRGFASCHAHLGSYYAKWVLSGRHLDGNHILRARRMMRWYAGQLLEVALSYTKPSAVKEYSHVA
jgi:hypothetical protein